MINILICDDDPKIIKEVKKLLQLIQNNTKMEFYIESKTDANSASKTNIKYDIAVLDIEMPGLNGLTLANNLKKINPDIIIIILTSFSDYLDSAMGISVFRYLSKPIDKNRFVNNFLEAIQHYKKLGKQIIVNRYDEVLTIRTKDILYIENSKHGSIIITKYDSFKSNLKPSEWADKINQPNCFVYSHKSFLVNLQNVINFDKSTVTFNTGKDIVKIACISQRKYTEFKKSFYNFMGG